MTRYRFAADPRDTFESFAMPMLSDLLLAAGAGGAIALLLPHPPEVRDRAGWILVAIALVVGVVLRALVGRTPSWFDECQPPLVIALVFAAVWVGGPGTAGVALAGLFTIGAAVMFSFVAWPRIVIYLSAIGIGYAALLAGQQVPGWPALVFLLVAELIAVTFVSRQLTDRLHDLAMQDELTGLGNRRAWYRRVTEELARAERTGDHLGVAILDLDRFKAVNDAEGHEAGDRLLVALARSWRPVLRGEDQLARWGGDEFALVAPGCDEAATRQVVERLAAAMPAPHTFSAGIATWEPGDSVDALVQRADARLYETKRARAEGSDEPLPRPEP